MLSSQCNGIQLKSFITDNEATLAECIRTASDDPIEICGLFPHSAKTAFEKLVDKNDVYFLPFCLHLMHGGKGVPKNEKFAMDAFEALYMADMITAYFYAYWLHAGGNYGKSEVILKTLYEAGFSPSMVTFGDWALGYNQIDVALKHYKSAIKFGNLLGLGCYYKTRFSYSNFPKKLIVLLIWIPRGITGVIKWYFKKSGPDCIYLNFYGIQHRPKN